MRKRTLELAALAVAILFLFFGCACKTEYVDRPVEVKVPVKCTPPEVEKPKQKATAVETRAELYRYTTDLEKALEVCK